MSCETASNDLGFFDLLGEVSSKEYQAGRGMITAIVIHKHDNKPGSGFYELANSLGLDVSDKDALWLGQVNVVHSYWNEHKD